MRTPPPNGDCWGNFPEHWQWPCMTQTRLRNRLLRLRLFRCRKGSVPSLQQAHWFHLSPCHDCAVLGRTVNCCKLLSLQAVQVSVRAWYHWLKLWTFFLFLLFDFQGGVLVKITEACPPLNCSEKDHILPENQCCRVCRGKWAWWWAELGLGVGWLWGPEGLMNCLVIMASKSLFAYLETWVPYLPFSVLVSLIRKWG